ALPRVEMGIATGTKTLMRTLRGYLGVTGITAMLTPRAQVHQTLLVAHVTPFDVAYQAQEHAIQSAFASQSGSVQAAQQTLAAGYNLAIRQATLLANIDNFRWLALVSMVCLIVVFALKKGQPHKPEAMAH